MFKKGLRHLVLIVLSILTSMTAEAQNLTLSNNLLYDAMLTPNLNIGYAPDSTTHWSYGFTAGFACWPSGNFTKRKGRQRDRSRDRVSRRPAAGGSGNADHWRRADRQRG